MKTKVFSSIMVLVLMFSTMQTYAAEDDVLANAMQEVYNEYKDDVQFQMMLADYGEAYAWEFIQDVAEGRLNCGMARGGGGNVCYEYVSNIMQTKTYNCGTTTVLQTLYGLDSAGNVSGATNTEKISTLDAEYNIDTQGQTYVYQIRDALNKYSKSSANYPYIYAEATNMTLAEFEMYIATSLMYGKPVVLHARTEEISYYGGKKSGHYLSLDYVDRTNDIVRIVDCNYNTAYYGIHTGVSLQDAYDSIHATAGRYLIY